MVKEIGRAVESKNENREKEGETSGGEKDGGEDDDGACSEDERPWLVRGVCEAITLNLPTLSGNFSSWKNFSSVGDLLTAVCLAFPKNQFCTKILTLETPTLIQDCFPGIWFYRMKALHALHSN